ncbi:MAG: hypothetical protein M1822_007455 [Bathelium mastoideum]|nr:MAG: hypothetical protein M1822_007455 [Bathelium mastoideum]
MPSPSSSPTAAAQPTRTLFDPWNSSSTGHQRAENRLLGSTAWRNSRTRKLAHQFRAGAGSGGGVRLADTVGAGSAEFGRDGRTSTGGWVRGASGLRGEGQRSLWECVGEGIGKEEGAIEEEEEGRPASGQGDRVEEGDDLGFGVGLFGAGARRNEKAQSEDRATKEGEAAAIERKPRPPQIFRSLTFYINGSTMPLISDHKLKQVLSAHGGNLSIALGRRTVTHVIIGVPCSTKGDIPGVGGGLAASKIQKEITRVGGKGVKFVGVEWVLASVKAGTRLSEARFETVKIGGAGQRSVLGMFEKGKKTEREKG